MQAKTEKLAETKTWEPIGADGEPIDLTKLPIQGKFVYDMEHRFQAYGGGLGNGKSLGLCLKAWYLSYLFPGNMGFIGRLDGKELRQTTLAEFRRLIPESFVAKRNDQIGYMKFKAQYGGSEIIYGDLKEDTFNNINLGWFGVDQAEEIDAARFELLVSRLRRKTPLIGQDDKPLTADGKTLYAPTYGFLAFNPEGTNSYIWRYFHPDSTERKPGYQLYQASTFDGLAAGFISKDYVDGMLQVFPPDARRRYLEGAWDVFSGRIFPQFDLQVHVVDYVKVLPYWKIYESIDHGIKNPTAVQWWAVDEYGNRFLLDEHYEGDGKPVKYHAEVIKSKRSQFKQPIALTYLDSACWAANQSRGDSVYAIVNEYNDNGIYPVQCQKNWDVGYSRICQGLAVDPNHKHPITDQVGSPKIFISSHCSAFIKEVTGYRWKKSRITSQLKNAPEEPMDFSDHHMDAWGYFEASRPTSAAPIERRQADVLDRIADRRKKYNPLAGSTERTGTWMSY